MTWCDPRSLSWSQQCTPAWVNRKVPLRVDNHMSAPPSNTHRQSYPSTWPTTRHQCRGRVPTSWRVKLQSFLEMLALIWMWHQLAEGAKVVSRILTTSLSSMLITTICILQILSVSLHRGIFLISLKLSAKQEQFAWKGLCAFSTKAVALVHQTSSMIPIALQRKLETLGKPLWERGQVSMVSVTRAKWQACLEDFCSKNARKNSTCSKTFNQKTQQPWCKPE